MFTLAITFGIIDSIVNQPELIRIRIDIDAADNTNALDHLFGIATVLATHQINRERMTFVEHRIVKEYIAIDVCLDLRFRVLPH